MKFQMNFTTSYDDVIRFTSVEDLQHFYIEHGCTGLEVMPLGYSTKDALDVYLPAEECPLIQPDMVTGIHCCCSGDWVKRNRSELIRHYRKDLDYAIRMGAEYVVFHVVQVDDGEGRTYKTKHTDWEVIEEADDFINALLDGQQYPFWFLMENLWWPGLTFLHPEDPMERFCKVYEHIFQIDRHEPFTAKGVEELVRRIDPLYVTYEYITRSREELSAYLQAGRLRL